MEEDIKILEEFTESSCCLASQEEIIECVKKLIKGYREIEKENKIIKARLIQTHNKASIEEKAKLYDVIDNSIDRYLESSKTILKNELMEG